MQQIIKWSRKNLFATRMNTLLSLVSLWLIYVTIDGVASWAFINASFLGAINLRLAKHAWSFHYVGIDPSRRSVMTEMS